MTQYKCPECGNSNDPHIISHFPPKIYQCLNCGVKGSEKDFLMKIDKHKFSTLPPPPPR